MILYGDLETYSERPLKYGTYQYAENCEILLFAWAIDDGPVSVWDLTDPDGELMPGDLYAGLSLADEIVFQNSMFDRSVFRLAKNSNMILQRAGCDIPRWRDTMVQALTHSLPGGLEKLGDVLRVDQDKRKLKVGKELVQLFCKPRPKNMKLRRATRDTHPIEWAQFVEYAAFDIHSMREIHKKCPKWNYRGDELALWHLDQRINDRGVCVDLDLARAAIGAVKDEQARLKDVGQEMTAGWVESLTKRDRLLEYILMEHGIDLPDLQKDTLQRRIEDPDLPIELRDLLAARLMATTSSTSKYQAIVRGVSNDGRLRGLLQFAGASRTARWAGRLFQPQNLPRPDMDQEEIDQCIEAIKDGSIDLVSDNVMRACSNAIRGVIVAPPGKKLVVGDLANIEGRMAAWLAGEDWKLQAFRDYDEGIGADLYKVAYAKAFNIPVEDVTKPMRQIGKVMELMLQYEGGVGAFITGAATYGIDLDKMAEAALPNVPADVLEEATGFYEWTVKQKRTTFGIAPDTFIACDALKRLWRRAHPAISSIWPELKDKVIEAINHPGQSYPCRRLISRRDGAWLKLQLPSGRFLCYPAPQVDDNGQISYMGVNQYSRQWSRIKTYGGKLLENCIAEDTLVLTLDGWVPIQTVPSGAAVWDGEDWVRTEGAVYKGKQFTLANYAVSMTPDHLVLTEKGWRRASSCKGHNRAACRIPDGYAVQGQQRCQVDMGSPMRLRNDYRDSRNRAAKAEQEGSHRLLRVYAEGNDSQALNEARDECTSSLLGVEVNGRPLFSSFSSSLEKLRGAWHFSVPRMAGFFRELLEGHGDGIPEGVYFGTAGQYAGVLSGQLCVANTESTGQQHKTDCFSGHPEWKDDHDRSMRFLRYQEVNAGVPGGPRLASQGGTDDACELSQSHVYDLLNCGPRSRFVVMGSDRRPLIVHNCTQAAARDVLAHSMPLVEADGMEIVLSVHDELITEAPDLPEYNTDRLCSHLATVPDWAEGIPLAAAGFEGYRYKKE